MQRRAGKRKSEILASIEKNGKILPVSDPQHLDA